MEKISLDYILDIVNLEKNKRNLNNYVPCYPMLRVEDNKLYIAVMLTNAQTNVWSDQEKTKAEYWCLLDTTTLEVIAFNQTSTKDYITSTLIENTNSTSQKEMSKYEVMKNIEYTNYLLDDIKNDNLPIQKKLSTVLNNEFTIDGENISINDYIMANIEDSIKKKVKELVNLVIETKYSSITFYYDALFNNIIKEYQANQTINYELIKVCIEVMENYYNAIIGIANFFNI